eukprot:8143901-Ditylum_brightwellii.AAC.1
MHTMDEGLADEDGNGLAIGVFEVPFCANMRATYIYEICEEIISKLKYAGTYQDDGLMIFQGHRSIKETISWLCIFQLQVDEVVGGSFFQFTAELWNPPGYVEISTFKEEENNLGILTYKWEN